MGITGPSRVFINSPGPPSLARPLPVIDDCFRDDFDRTDRYLPGDNGWFAGASPWAPAMITDGVVTALPVFDWGDFQGGAAVFRQSSVDSTWTLNFSRTAQVGVDNEYAVAALHVRSTGRDYGIRGNTDRPFTGVIAECLAYDDDILVTLGSYVEGILVERPLWLESFGTSLLDHTVVLTLDGDDWVVTVDFAENGFTRSGTFTDTDFSSAFGTLAGFRLTNSPNSYAHVWATTTVTGFSDTTQGFTDIFDRSDRALAGDNEWLDIILPMMKIESGNAVTEYSGGSSLMRASAVNTTYEITVVFDELTGPLDAQYVGIIAHDNLVFGPDRRYLAAYVIHGYGYANLVMVQGIGYEASIITMEDHPAQTIGVEHSLVFALVGDNWAIRYGDDGLLWLDGNFLGYVPAANEINAGFLVAHEPVEGSWTPRVVQFNECLPLIDDVAYG